MNETTRAAKAARVDTGLDVVTGAFSYSGSAMASRLLGQGRRVRTLTGHPSRAPHGSSIEVEPLEFSDYDALTRSLEGVTTLFNTYWVRFAKDGTNHDLATRNSATLFSAARRAGVQRVVHVSITNPSEDSEFAYYRGKAHTERALIESGVSYAILRPAILFGGNGILINNIAYFLRHLPVFGVGGRAQYRIRGIHVDDLADLALVHSTSDDNVVIDAVGPERPTFRELVTNVKRAVGSRALVVSVPPPVLPFATGLIGKFMGDVILTRDEYRAMAAGLADSTAPTTGATSISTWIRDAAPQLGEHYLHEINLHFDAQA